MSYYLGIIPNQKSNYKIRKVVGDIGHVFDGQGVDVRWVKPESFHISIISFGDRLNPISRLILNLKLSKFLYKSFNIRFDKVNLGISRGYKELVYLSLIEGGDDLRNILYKLRESVKVKESSIFIPHVTLGRVSKDLTNEEFRNLTLDVRNANKDLDIEKESFPVNSVSLYKAMPDSTVEVIKEYPLA